MARCIFPSPPFPSPLFPFHLVTEARLSVKRQVTYGPRRYPLTFPSRHRSPNFPVVARHNEFKQTSRNRGRAISPLIDARLSYYRSIVKSKSVWNFYPSKIIIFTSVKILYNFLVFNNNLIIFFRSCIWKELK